MFLAATFLHTESPTHPTKVAAKSSIFAAMAHARVAQ